MHDASIYIYIYIFFFPGMYELVYTDDKLEWAGRPTAYRV